MDAETPAEVKAKVLHTFTRNTPQIEYSYSWSPACEHVIRWMKTPAGTIVRQADYRQAETTRGAWFWKRHFPAETTTETKPYDKSMDALLAFMKDTNMSMNEAAEVLQLDSGW